ncbi:pyruvate kinase [Rubricoccus marinus]|uniref:Pyruvate kinase n=1 Tax=Rubricoccus marinus TaxID=716817 RepID=A0A259U137_9BACT|nr:pyruvate kinase [Rubricoccus marinus]OZC03735.1 pyruvate kinase [Rubricoccus marinus]
MRTRRTKIVCTLGPASDSRDAISALIKAGMDVARMNFSHGSHADHERRIGIVREEAKKQGRVVPILQDLQGPKIRLGAMEEGGALIHAGNTIRLTAQPVAIGTEERVHVSYDALAEEVVQGGRILIDDGNIELKIIDVDGQDVVTEVVIGGVLKTKKGVNLPQIVAARPGMTPKDIEDLAFGLTQDVEFIALSFVRTARDIDNLAQRIRSEGKSVGIIAKVEKPEAVENFDSVLRAADGIMVARGDLGVEIPIQRVPIVQKQLIRGCLQASKPVITATQMLESMMENPRPTRAEATDVANAVLDGTDAVMLSGETAAGKFPARAVEIMDEIVREAESNRRRLGGRQALDSDTADASQITRAISSQAVDLAGAIEARALCCLTHSGSTAREIASHRPDMPIYAFTDSERTVGRMGLTWGTEAVKIPFQEHTDDGIRTIHRRMMEEGLGKAGDHVVVTAGLPLVAVGKTNMVHVTTLGEDWV